MSLGAWVGRCEHLKNHGLVSAVWQVLPQWTTVPDLCVLGGSLGPFGIIFQLPLVRLMGIRFSPLL